MAVQRLQSTYPQNQMFLSSEKELAALNVLEEFVRTNPGECLQKSPQAPSASPTSDLASHYGEHLLLSAQRAAGGAAGHSLTPAISQALSEVHWELLKDQQSGFTLLGTVDDLATANKATAPVAGMDWGVKITGYWNDHQRENVEKAVTELSRKTGTKAMNLLREVHLSTYLGTLPEGPILGITRTVGPVAILREQSELNGNTRWILFHEVGHQLDRFLAKSSVRFRSHDADTPFGKTDRVQDYVHPSLLGSPHEDFADTHAMTILHWDEIKANPDLYLHARGEIGRKMSWILTNAYKEEIPAPSERLVALYRRVDEGQTPFADRADFEAAVNDYVRVPESLSGERREWLNSVFPRQGKC